MLRLGVEGHRRLLDLGALLGEEHCLGLGDGLGEVQGAGDDHRLATGRHAIQRVPRQAAIKAAGLSRIEVLP
ncbi:hypothetical protein D3C78_871950 [compost metagenome]